MQTKPPQSSRAVRLMRTAWRLALVAGIFAWAGADFLLRLGLRGKGRDLRARCEWNFLWSRRVLWCVNVRADYSGEPPRAGLLVSNHLGYLDILVLAARQPAVFVSRADVRGWPVIGFFTSLAGTLFVRREKRGDVSPLNDQMTARLRAGHLVVVFPEGASTDGHQMRPFFSSLLQPAVTVGCPVTPAFIRYELADGSVEDEVCYWGDMTFGPHLLNLLSKREIRAHVRFGAARPPGDDRKQLAKELQQAVRELGGI